MLRARIFHLLWLFCLCECLRTCFGNPKKWAYHTILDGDGKYHLYWSPPGFMDDTGHIHFKVEVETHGYVGFGLSPNGGMAGSDIVTGYIIEGNVYFEDRYAKGRFLPEIDETRNWFVTDAFENDTHTVFEFYRDLDTCDPKDRKIDNSTMRIIYAYTFKDPEIGHLPYHDERGSKSVLLLQPKLQSSKRINKSKLKYWDIKSPNYTISSKYDTMYWCKVYKAPKLKQKHHIVMVEPRIESGHEEFVHHMLLYECVGAVEDQYDYLMDHQGHQCHRFNMPEEMKKCEGVVLAWGVGGSTLVLPDDVGLPLHTDPRYYMIEIHYDNPSRKGDIIDHSGFRLYYTSHLRKFDAGNLMIGSTVSQRHFIPPGLKEYVVSAHSNRDCLGPVMDEVGVQILGVFLHAHLIGRRIKVRHFRNGTELPPLAEDKNYDFNYQDYRLFQDKVTFLPDDQLTVECTYDSSERNITTFGGESTNNEMCLAFLLHYPKLERFASVSVPKVEEINRAIGPKNTFQELFSVKFNWSAIDLDQLEHILRYSQQDTYCYLGNGTKNTVKSLVSYPPNVEEYKTYDVCLMSRGERAHCCARIHIYFILFLYILVKNYFTNYF